MAAIDVGGALGGPITERFFSNLYDRTFDKIVQRGDDVPKEGMQFFSEVSTNEETYKEGALINEVDLPRVSSDTDPIHLLQPMQGHTKSFTNIIYQAGIMVTRSAIRRQHTRLISGMLTGLPASAARKAEYAMANVINNGFSTELTGDGLAVFHDAHTQDKDPEKGETFDNLMAASGVTSTAVNLAWQHFQNWESARGFVRPQNLSHIVYPVALQESVQKTLRSDQVPENALNAINPWKGICKPILWHYMSSATAHFYVGDNDEASKGLRIVWEVKPTYAPIKEAGSNIEWSRYLYMAFSVGAIQSCNLLGNAGA